MDSGTAFGTQSGTKINAVFCGNNSGTGESATESKLLYEDTSNSNAAFCASYDSSGPVVLLKATNGTTTNEVMVNTSNISLISATPVKFSGLFSSVATPSGTEKKMVVDSTDSVFAIADTITLPARSMATITSPTTVTVSNTTAFFAAPLATLNVAGSCSLSSGNLAYAGTSNTYHLEINASVSHNVLLITQSILVGIILDGTVVVSNQIDVEAGVTRNCSVSWIATLASDTFGVVIKNATSASNVVVKTAQLTLS
jgi:hypothetical protein